MKTWICLSLLLTIVSRGILAQQDATVLLSNTSAQAPVLIHPDELAPVNGTFVQVLSRPLGSSGEFVPLANIANGRTAFELLVPGFFVAGISDRIPGVFAGEEAEFFVRGWRGAMTWEEAQNNPNALKGQTPVFVNKTGYLSSSDMQPNHVPEPLVNMPSLVLVPEPSTFVLIGFGLGVVLITRIYFGEKRATQAVR